MILEKQKEAMIVTDGDEVSESIGMSLDMDSAQILMNMLSKNLYSDPIGSTIRETVSNGVDSHRKVGIDDPVIVTFEINSNNDYEFSVEDFGVGLDADDVRNIISKYGKSTKRDSNLFIGAMGLGWKSPLAYSSSFYFVCRKDGIERKYMMYEGEEVNTIDLLHEVETSKQNGVKVIIPVKYNDRQLFYDKIKEQLAYFENVYFDINVNGKVINNDFNIYRGEHFQYSELTKDRNMHICLDNVYYPIDFAKLNLGAIEFPIALRFSLSDGVFPTPNRESIRYTSEAKSIILDKIKLMSDHFIHKYNEISKECNTYAQIHDYYNTNNRYVEVIPEVCLNVSYLSTFSDVKIMKPTLKDVKHLDLKKLTDNNNQIMGEYSVMFQLQSNKISNFTRKYRNSWESTVSNFTNNSKKNYIYSNNFPEIKKSYLREFLPGGYSNTYRFLKKVKEYKLFPKKNLFDSRDNYYDLLTLSKIDKCHWREAILEFQGIVKSIINTFSDLDDVVVPDSFIQSKKKSRCKSSTDRKTKLAGEINLKIATDLERYVSDKSCKFVSSVVKLSDLAKNGKFIIYAHHDDSNKLDKLYNIENNKLVKIMLVTLSSRELKILESMEFKNTISYSKFMEGNSKPFKRMVTGFLINDLCSENSRLVRKINLVHSISVDIHDRLIKLREYNLTNIYSCHFNTKVAMIEVAKINNSFDMTIYPEYLRMVKILDDLYFLTELVGRMDTWGSSQNNVTYVKVIVDLMKYHKYKVNIDHYNSSKVEETSIEEIINQVD